MPARDEHRHAHPPASSVASERVKPTTPNFSRSTRSRPEDAQPERRGDGHDRPPLARRRGSAAWTTAAVPRRFTATIRSQSSHAVSASGAGRVDAGRRHDAADVAVLLDHARDRRARVGGGGEVDDLAQHAVVGSPAVEHDRRPAGARRRRPRRRRRGPEAPPVTMTVPSSDRHGRRPPASVGCWSGPSRNGSELDAPAPLGDDLGLRAGPRPRSRRPSPTRRAQPLEHAGRACPRRR